MAALVRKDSGTWTLQWLLLHIVVFALCMPLVLAHPTHSRSHPNPMHTAMDTSTVAGTGMGMGITLALAPRSFVITNSSGTPEVINPTTELPIPQGAATDGSGAGFDISAILWLAFSFAVGAPMAVAGVRLWRITTGVGIGLSAAVCAWAALNNSVNNNGVPDVVLTAIVFGFFVVGFVFGVFEIGRVAGIALLGVTGGLAFGVRVVILKSGLLVPDLSVYSVNWVIIGAFGVLGGAAMVGQKTQRGGMLFGSASVGTFLVGLGVDLVINQQSGMSRGLRFLFDRNASHALDIIVGGYTPPLSTQIQLGVSLGLTPILAYIQHRVFKQPFSRKSRPESITPLPDFLEEEPKDTANGQETRRQTRLMFNLWETMKAIEGSARSRFSL